MAELNGASGQAAPVDSKGTTTAAPKGNQEQSAAPAKTTVTGSQGEAESFFDPKSIQGKPELEAAYKQMQGKFTKEMQKFKEGTKKVKAYDDFIKDPMSTMRQVAQQLGYSLVQRDPSAKEEDAAPKTWADVYAKAKEEVLKELQPIVGEVQQLKKQNVEQWLDNNHSDWRQYESEMLETLQTHPSLAHDPAALYRLSVPAEVLEARATKAALEKLKGTEAHGEISGTSTATKQVSTTDKPSMGASFNDHVAWAKAQLARQGIKAPVGG